MPGNNNSGAPVADRTEYVPTTWVNDVTKLNATNLNHIETGIKNNNSLALENAGYLDELEVSMVEKMDIDFNAAENTLTMYFGLERDEDPSDPNFNANGRRYYKKRCISVQPSHTYASSDDIDSLFVR